MLTQSVPSSPPNISFFSKVLSEPVNTLPSPRSLIDRTSAFALPIIAGLSVAAVTSSALFGSVVVGGAALFFALLVMSCCPGEKTNTHHHHHSSHVPVAYPPASVDYTPYADYTPPVNYTPSVATPMMPRPAACRRRVVTSTPVDERRFAVGSVRAAPVVAAEAPVYNRPAVAGSRYPVGAAHGPVYQQAARQVGPSPGPAMVAARPGPIAQEQNHSAHYAVGSRRV